MTQAFVRRGFVGEPNPREFLAHVRGRGGRRRLSVSMPPAPRGFARRARRAARPPRAPSSSRRCRRAPRTYAKLDQCHGFHRPPPSEDRPELVLPVLVLFLAASSRAALHFHFRRPRHGRAPPLLNVIARRRRRRDGVAYAFRAFRPSLGAQERVYSLGPLSSFF